MDSLGIGLKHPRQPHQCGNELLIAHILSILVIAKASVRATRGDGDHIVEFLTLRAIEEA